MGASLSQTIARSVPKEFIKDHTALWAALSPVYGMVRKVSLPTHLVSQSPVVIHIQDVHMNQEAQWNIRGAVRSLMQSGQVDLVALEGATEEIHLQPFVDFPHRHAVEVTANYLLKQNKITGPIHAAFTATGTLPKIIGIDDPTHYAANVRAYTDSSVRLEKTRQDVKGLQDRIEGGKKAVYSQELLAFDEGVRSYHKGEISLGDHVLNLTQKVPNNEAPAIHSFKEALALERTLDFKQVEVERAFLIAALTQRLNELETKDFLAQSLAYRSGQLPYAEFYSRLKDTCQSKGLPLSRFPSMEAYVRYVLTADGIDAEGLLENLSDLEKRGYDRLAKSKEEKALVAQSRQAWLSEKLVDFSLTPADWKEYQATGIAGTKEERASYEAFYHEAQARDGAMAENVLRAIGPHGSAPPRTAVLVTGGYHAEGMTQRLVQQGVVVVSYVPKIEKIDTAQGSAYLSVFTQEKTPLEKLFAGQKLFLGMNPLAGVPEAAVLVPAVARVENSSLSVMSEKDMAKIDEYIKKFSPEAKLTIGVPKQKKDGGWVVTVQVQEGEEARKFSLVTNGKFDIESFGIVDHEDRPPSAWFFEAVIWIHQKLRTYAKRVSPSTAAVSWASLSSWTPANFFWFARHHTVNTPRDLSFLLGWMAMESVAPYLRRLSRLQMQGMWEKMRSAFDRHVYWNRLDLFALVAIYGGLIALTPFPLLEFTGLGFGFPLIGWGLALGLDRQFDRQVNTSILSPIVSAEVSMSLEGENAFVRRQAIYRLIVLFNQNERAFWAAWSLLDPKTIEAAIKSGVKSRVENNVWKRLNRFDVSVEKQREAHSVERREWERSARLALGTDTFRILNVFGYDPEWVGSGTVLKNIVREEKRYGDVPIVALTGQRGAERDPAFPEGTATERIWHADPSRGEFSRGPPDIGFPTPTYSSDLPFSHTRFQNLSPLEWVEYLEVNYEQIARSITKYSPHIIHSHHVFTLNALAKLAAPWIPIVVSSHGTEQKVLRDRGPPTPGIIEAAQAADAIIIPTEDMREETKEIFKVSDKTVQTIEHGFDEDRFRPRSTDRAAFLRQYGAPEGIERIVAFAGKFSAWKGLDYFLQAVPLYQGEKPGTVLTIIEGGGDPETNAVVRAQVDDLNRRGFPTRYIPWEDLKDVANLMAATDVFVLPSVREPFGLLLLEAMASGCRVVAARTGGPARMVPPAMEEEGQAHLVDPLTVSEHVSPATPDGMAYSTRLGNAVLELLKKPSTPEQRGMIGAQVAGRSWRAAYGSLRKTYREIVSQKLGLGVNHRPFWVSSKDPLAKEEAVVGNKARGLALLEESGVSIPEWVSLTTEAMDAFINRDASLSKLISEWRESLGSPLMSYRLASEIREKMMTGSLPAAVQEALRQIHASFPPGTRLKVRSSAIGEDSAEASYAGRYETISDVSSLEELERAVRAVWASLYSEEAIQYRRLQIRGPSGTNPKESMAIVIQRQVSSVASGVAYSVDPGTGQSHVIVEAHEGDGKNMVEGYSQPDRWIFDPESKGVPLLEKTIWPKISEAGQPVWKAAVNDAQARKVAEQTRLIKDAWRRRGITLPVDWEFAFDENGDLFCLQARPVTGIPPGEDGGRRSPR
ncbi:MAG: glycosyltransferase [Elusimicrobia bacterium]|nr:glycosyltransferase [Elusimicrobiota bacterium]